MNSKAPFLLAAGAAALVLAFGFYLHLPTAMHETATVPDNDEPAGLLSPSILSAPPARGIGERAVATAPRAAVPTLAEGSNALGIRPEFLRDAEKQAEDIAAHMVHYKSTLGEAAYLDQSLSVENPSRKLALRLGLDAGTAKRMEAAISAQLARQIKQRIDAAKVKMERQEQLLSDARETFVNYLALQSMVSYGESLSKEQADFFDRFRKTLEPDAEGVPMAAASWYENPEILEAVKQQLSVAQRSALAGYVEEQKRRDQETQTMHVYMRSNMIAEQLGLDNEERAALNEYLYKHPNATRADIAKIVAPELRELLPEGM